MTVKTMRKNTDIVDKYFKNRLKNKEFNTVESVNYKLILVISLIFIFIAILGFVQSVLLYKMGFETRIHAICLVALTLMFIILSKAKNFILALYGFGVLSIITTITNYLTLNGYKKAIPIIILLGFLFVVTALACNHVAKVIISVVYVLFFAITIPAEIILFNSTYTYVLRISISVMIILIGISLVINIFYINIVKLSIGKEKLLGIIKEREDTIVMQERTVVLSELISNAFYEIYAPFGAIRVSSDICVDSMESIVHGLDSLLMINMTEDNINVLKRLIGMVIEEAQSEFVKEDVNKKKQMILEIFDNEGVNNAEEIVDSLFELGIRNTNIVKDNIDMLHRNDIIELLKIIIPYYDIINGIYIIKESSRKNTNVLNALKTFIEDSNADVESKIDIPRLIDNVVSLYCGQKGAIEVIKEFDDNIPSIWGRKDEINQIWVNIISNSLYAMGQKGNMTISIKNLNNKYVRVLIGDTGIGIEPENLSRIFEPLFTTKSRVVGSGLGMYITKRIVKKYKGSITVDSEPNVGTTVIVTLPVKNHV